MHNRKLVDVFNSLLDAAAPLQVVSYDTTFNLGDFYLSVLLFRETEFIENPVIPLAYLLLDRKLTATHDNFFRHISAVICRRLT